MIILTRLAFVAITLYMFISLYLDKIDDMKYFIPYKIYLFLFVFLIHFIFHSLSNLLNMENHQLSTMIEISINNALLAVIAYDVYNDLVRNGIYDQFNNQQRMLILVFLIIGFMVVIKLLQLLISCN